MEEKSYIQKITPFIDNMRNVKGEDTPTPVPPGPEPGPDTSLLPEFFVPYVVGQSEIGAEGLEELGIFLTLFNETGAYQDFLISLIKFKAKLPLPDEPTEPLEDAIIYYMESTGELSADMYYYPVKDPSKKYCTSVSIETEAETGDSRYVFGEVTIVEE